MAKSDPPSTPRPRASAASADPQTKATPASARASGKAKPKDKPAASKASGRSAAKASDSTSAASRAAAKPAASKRSASSTASKKSAATRTKSAEAKSAESPSEPAMNLVASLELPAQQSRPRTAAQGQTAFDALVRTACLKAGTAAAISSLTRRVPLIGRLAPTVLGPLAETVALAQVQKALVRSIIDLYEVELSDPEQRGVVLLATAANIGAQQLSKRSLEAILKQFGSGLVGTVAARVLPVASVLAEITAAVASTYTVGKRAQALCKLPGTGVGNLADLLRGLSGIDQARLLSWSGEAFRLALLPFRSVLGMLWK